MVALGMRPPDIESVRQALAYQLVPAPPYVAAAFESGTASFVLNVGHCACDYFKNPIDPEEVERLRVKYEKRGWSQNRIQRAMAERSKVGGLELGLLQNIVAAAKTVGNLALLVYWDDGATTPKGRAVQATAQELVAQPHIVRAGSRVDITP